MITLRLQPFPQGFFTRDRNGLHQGSCLFTCQTPYLKTASVSVEVFDLDPLLPAGLHHLERTAASTAAAKVPWLGGTMPVSAAIRGRTKQIVSTSNLGALRRKAQYSIAGHVLSQVRMMGRVQTACTSHQLVPE